MNIGDRLPGTLGVRINNSNGDPHDGDARCYPVSINSQFDGAIICLEIAGRSPTQIESMASIGVCDALDIDGGGWLGLDIH